MTHTIRAGLVAGFILASAGAACAQNSDAGSGLSPYAAERGNDRSAGVNNGNYRPPRLDPYLGAYDRPVYGREYRRRPAPYYGYPY